MRVRVKLFASLSRFANGARPGAPLVIELPEGATLADLIQRLQIPAEEAKLTFVNGRACPPDWQLQPGDEIGIFPPIAGGSPDEITVDTWLYGDLARFAGSGNQGGYANVRVFLPQGSTLHDLLTFLNMPTEERGITFINGKLSALPGLQPDLGYVLNDGDRVAFFHLKSMWPFQYRHGAAMIAELSERVHADLRHSYGVKADEP